ncbi:MAG: hypothetical protein WCY11_07875 [Novosphingobium sp.]
MLRQALVLAVLVSPVFGSTLASAQDAPAATGGERINQLIVYGDDPCPAPTSADEITVCARKDEGERYRIPEPLRGIESPKAVAWSERVRAYETVTARGTLSCSPVGPGGALGCTQQLIDAAYAERKGGSDVQFSKLIEEERARRLQAIDAEAAETQSRVEEIERQYEQLQQDAANADSQSTPPATGKP